MQSARSGIASNVLPLAQNAAHLGVCEWDLTTNGFVYSEEYARLYGLSPDHPPLTLEDLPKHIHPDDRERIQADRQRRSRSGRTHGTPNTACCGLTEAYTGYTPKARFSWNPQGGRFAQRASFSMSLNASESKKHLPSS